jgi:uncharacterized membrane protein
MQKNRIEAFSDGVIAIIITIMVLELKVPHNAELAGLLELCQVFLSYLLSFIYIGIYWNNHHHLFHAVKKVDGLMLWLNLHLLFWLSLIPFVTGWMGENHFAPIPVAFYGAILFMAAIAYYLLVRRIVAYHGKTSPIGMAIGKDMKGIISIVLYVLGMALSLVLPYVSLLVYSTVAALWLIPDRRIEVNVHE